MSKEARASSPLSRVQPTELACLQELLKRLQDRHVEYAQSVAKKAVADATSTPTVNADTPNVLQAMMKLEQTKARAKTANKVALEVEKEKDTAEKAVEELKWQLQPKTTRTDDDTGDAHDLLAEFDNCDLSDHRQMTIQLLVQGMLACARARTWIPVEWPRSLGDSLYTY